MPKQHGKDSRHAEHQRKGEKIPLFPEKIYIRVLKKFHSIKTPFSIIPRKSASKIRPQTQMLNASPRCLRLRIQSKITRETNTAVNRFASKPNVSVTANPLTGPVPKMNRMNADTIVVTCVSTIVIQA